MLSHVKLHFTNTYPYLMRPSLLRCAEVQRKYEKTCAMANAIKQSKHLHSLMKFYSKLAPDECKWELVDSKD
ncbi:predicted protein [Sclerotinia sclerotiorum 1980 UF-70]|uniref:Uncharacterized protein n=1 Tax=Sclerotinia sclerotiorum (strain ATCC 18683 / 1980 / Ss-1) TaxID=665079 RepID=A7F1B0_SCLS1|nr:predicted protein [Sclerotinia sclerotiorum 1980 UF-70]EDN95502.1 predicted protein [Sclerotinia sclerotiorum 1980 UF-70]